MLCDNGFPPLGAFRLLLAVGHYVTGFVIEEQGAERRHSVSIGPVPDEAEIRAATPMLFGALLTGLEATRTTGSPR